MIVQYVYVLCGGMVYNLSLWFFGGIMSLITGILFGCLSHTRAPAKGISTLVRGYILIARGIPLYIHLLWIYFVIPQITPLHFSPYIAALIAIVSCVTAYCTEIIRAAINHISKGQWQAAYVLGYSYRQTLRYIIVPQCIPVVLPVLGNLFEELLKSTAIVSVIGVMDITRTGMNIIARDMNIGTVYCLIALIYLTVSLMLQAMLYWLSTKVAR
jgi:His/Glu/Gln/Arg/opine family amino acid ABC transporter permease subunit